MNVHTPSLLGLKSASEEVKVRFFHGAVHRHIFPFGEAFKGSTGPVSELQKKDPFGPPHWFVLHPLRASHRLLRHHCYDSHSHLYLGPKHRASTVLHST